MRLHRLGVVAQAHHLRHDDLPVVGDIKDALTRLNKMLAARPLNKKHAPWLAQIAEWPQIGRRVIGVSNDVPARRVPVKRFPYQVVYLPWEGALRILAFADDSREPGYWLSRIRK